MPCPCPWSPSLSQACKTVGFHRLNKFRYVAESLEKKHAVNLMIWLQLLMLSTARRLKNEWMRMELRWDNKYQASIWPGLSFSPVTQRDVLELMGIIAKQTSLCVCL